MVKQIAWVVFHLEYESKVNVIRSFSYNEKELADIVKARFIAQKQFVAMVKVELTLPAPNPLIIATVEVV